MKSNLKRIFIFLFLILILTSFASAYVRSVWLGGGKLSFPGATTFLDNSLAFDKSMCQEGTDFMLQIVPYSCEPFVVRSDILEEEDVPVFCQLSAIQLNPLVDVEAIKTMSITKESPIPEVKAIGYLPSQSALGLIPSGDLENPVLNNLGNVVITLRRNANESSMPDYVNGTLKATIMYDAENAWGVGKAEFLLPEMTDSEFEDDFRQYGFWRGNGYLRASGITETGATVYIYSDRTVATSLPSRQESREYSHLSYSHYNLKVGETSPEIFLPGFNPCLAALKLKLNSIENPDTAVRLRINEEILDIRKNQEFLEGKCVVQEIISRGLYQSVKINCKDDEKGSETFELGISPNIRLAADDNQEDYEMGEYVGLFDEKYVYVGHVGSNPNSDSSNPSELFVVLIAIPNYQGPNLDADTLRDVSTFAKYRAKDSETGAFAVDALKDVFTTSSSIVVAGIKGTISGEDFKLIKSGETQEFRGSSFSLFGLAEDSAYSSLTDSFSEYKEKYDNAVKDFRVVLSSYADEKQKETDEKTYGENSLYELIVVSNRLKLNQNVDELCIEFEEKYPTSDYWSELEDVCYSGLLDSSSSMTEYFVLINGEDKKISFQRVIEPTFEEYGARVFVRSPDGNTGEFDLEKDKIVYLSSLRNDPTGYEEEYISLEDLDIDSADIKIHVSQSSETLIQKVFRTDTRTLQLEKEVSQGGYTFYLSRVNLDRVAKVSVIPIVNNEFSNSSFPFQIAIEKRNFKLSPEKISDKIDGLDKKIENLEKSVGFLGGVVKFGNTACLGTGLVLQVKNFLQGMDGSSIARTEVMQGPGGWNERCQLEISKDDSKYRTLDQCYLAHSDEIDRQVADYARNLNSQQEQLKECNEKAKEQDGFLGEGYVNQQKLKDCLSGEFETIRFDLDDSLRGVQGIEDGKLYKDPSKTGEEDEYIDLSEIDNLLSPDHFIEGKYYSIDDLKEIEFYRDVLNDPQASDSSKQKAREKLYSLLGDLKVQAVDTEERETWANSVGVNPENILSIGVDPSKKYYYTGETCGNQNTNIEGCQDDTPVKFITIGTKRYVLVLDDSSGAKEMAVRHVFDDKGNLIGTSEESFLLPFSSVDIDKPIPEEFQGMSFIRVDKESLNNKYLNPKIQYFDSGSYEGFPAVVPFDKESGWYAATKFVMGEGRQIASYDESGVLRFYYICNVGENGLEEYMGGDDSCGAINKADSFEDTFYGVLSDGERANLVKKAESAIEDAQKASRNARNRVRIGGVNGEWYEVGQPKFETSSIQCQDFMSPKDCSLLYNVCDPFVCPSSRCDLGGNYPVRDVVQSGIIGSIALCYPNAKWHGGDVYVPVCVTGVYAGLDGWLQVRKAYRDCLQTQLDTGEVVGICDATQSIYMCDFFYRQLRPFVQYIGTKLISVIRGETLYRGGGEYQNVQDALSKAKNSLDYFKQYYAEEAYRAFELRSTTELNFNDPCNTFSSVLFPNGVEVLDSLTQARSPFQFYGKFDEIPMTTRTNPPLSHYKVYYQIYSGNTAGAYYKVYLRGDGGGTYYFDTSFDRIVDSGYIGVGETKVETKDFQAPAGYTRLCILVNGHEECGFQQVSTSFAVNYAKDWYLTQQAKQTDVTTEEDCISGTTSLYSLMLNINPQAAAEELIDPAIYDRGIQRVCRPEDPGLGIDVEAGTEDSRWKRVGYCDNPEVGCWLDTDSVKDVIDAANLEESVLNVTSQSNLEYLFNTSDYLTPKEFEQKLKEFDNLDQRDYETRINFLTEVIDNLFWSSQKGLIYFLRGKTYADSIYVEQCSYGICGEDNNLYYAFKTSADGECQKSNAVDEYCDEGCSRGICLEDETPEDFSESLSKGYNYLEISEKYPVKYQGNDYVFEILEVRMNENNSEGPEVTFYFGNSNQPINLPIGGADRFDLDGDGDDDVRLTISDVSEDQVGVHLEFFPEDCALEGGVCELPENCPDERNLGEGTTCDEIGQVCCYPISGGFSTWYRIKYIYTTSDQDIYYKYSEQDGGWYWTSERNVRDQAVSFPGWNSVNDVSTGLYLRDVNLIRALQGKSYLEGVTSFVRNGSNEQLSEELASGLGSLAAEGDVFTMNYGDFITSRRSLFYYDGRNWNFQTDGIGKKDNWVYFTSTNYDPEKVDWIDVSDLRRIYDYINVENKEIPEQTMEVIEALRTKGFYDGADIIFNPWQANDGIEEITEEDRNQYQSEDGIGESSYFRLNADGTKGKGLYYKHSPSHGWHWTWNEEDILTPISEGKWIPVSSTDFEDDEIKRNTRRGDENVINLLGGRTYSQGLDMFIKITTEEEFGKYLEGENAILRTNSVLLDRDPTKYYYTNYHSAGDNIVFYWNYDNWVFGYEEKEKRAYVTTDIFYRWKDVNNDEAIKQWELGHRIISSDKNVLYALRDKGKVEGADIIFHPYKAPNYFGASVVAASAAQQLIVNIAERKIGSDTTRYEKGGEVYDNVCSAFVSTVLIEAGLLPEFGDTCELEETTEIASIRYGLVPKLYESEDFSEISNNFWEKGLIPGDLIIWGCKGLSYCSSKPDADEYQHITIFREYAPSGGITVTHDPGAGVDGKVGNRTYPDPFGNSWYIAHVWRYVGDVKGQPGETTGTFTREDVYDALNQLEEEFNLDWFRLDNPKEYDYEAVMESLPKIREAFTLLVERLNEEQMEVLREDTFVLTNYEGSVSPFTGYQGNWPYLGINHEDYVDELVEGLQEAIDIHIIGKGNQKEIRRISELYGIQIVYWDNANYDPEDIKPYLDEGNLERAISRLDEDELNFLKDYRIVLSHRGHNGVVESEEGNKLISIDYAESARRIRITIRDSIDELREE